MYKNLRTYLGRVIRDIGRKIEGNGGLEATFTRLTVAGAPCARAAARTGRRSIPCKRRKLRFLGGEPKLVLYSISRPS